MSLAKPEANNLSTKQKVAVALGIMGLLILVLAVFNTNFPNKTVFLSLSLGLMFTGTILFSNAIYLQKTKGIKNDGVWFKSLSSRGILAWATGVLLTGFYIVLYFYPQYLGLSSNGASNTGLISLFDPLSYLLNGNPASQWFVYGTLYTVAILVFGYKFMLKYR
ncbi:MAG TPA: FeS-binding protein, partial [Mariniflexile sp.]|nr:FeS-binding protein [Mariniflexile sp.]